MKAKIGLRFAILTALVLLLEVIPCKAAKVQQLCVNPSSQSCSSTIQDAVNQAKGSAVITVVAGTFTENVTINLTKPKKLTLTITGAGVGSTIVDGGNDGRVFDVGPKTTLTLSGMTIQNGSTSTTGAGGGILSDSATITIDDCLITGNTANLGGGMYINGGSLTLKNSTVSNNVAYIPYSSIINPFGNYELGGGMFFNGNNLTITSSTFTGNTANSGGGVMMASGTTTIQGSTISDNTAKPIEPPGGGGLFIGAEGGAIFVSKSSLTMLNSTISENAAETDPGILQSVGGGIENVKGKVTLNNVTIADNQASEGGGIRTPNGKSFTSSNSIIAENSSDDCEGILHSMGFNLILDASGCTIKGSTSTDVIGEDPMLQPLALNAPGTTETQALMDGSPALEAGSPAKPNGLMNHCLATDQRGVTRPKGACDIGAFQLSN